MGYADLSSYGRTDFQTPVIDAFINEGTKFTQAYSAAAVCTPTRVGLMTGKYPARNRIGLYEPLRTGTDDDKGLSNEYPTLSSLMKNSGYETVLIGKWHLGIKPEFLPMAHGFDQFFGITGGHADYVSHNSALGDNMLFQNERPVKKDGYLTDLLTEYTVEFIKGNHHKPFFISLQYNSPHWPWQIPGDQAYPTGESVSDFVAGGSMETYAGMVKNLDMNIGKVLNALEEAGLAKTTVVIFTSDNGGDKYSDMGPFQGRKGNLYEGGIRVPAAVRWPGIITAGTQSEQVVITMDWTVSILDLAKAFIPEDVSFDGISLVEHLKGNATVNPRKLFWRNGRQGSDGLQNAYRDGDWKYLKTGAGEFLFDLKTDPGEINDLKVVNPEKFNQLKNDFEELNGKMLARGRNEV